MHLQTTNIYIYIYIERERERERERVHKHIHIWIYGFNHGCQNLDLDPMILWFYDLTCHKRSGSFNDFCDHSGSVRSYNSNDPKWPWFHVIFFDLTEGSVEPKWKIKS